MKKAIVVGASSGIGREVAKQLMANGYKVGITGRREELLLNLKAENPEQYVVKAFDCTTSNNGDVLAELTAELGGLDLLLISSGTGMFNKHLDIEIEEKTNVLNIVAFTQIADWTYNFFRAQKHGHLAAITSISGIRGGKAAPAYNASKAYQISYLQGLLQRSISKKEGVLITDIRPGFVDTPMAQGPSRFWVASPEKAGKQIFTSLQHKRQVVYVTKRWRLIAILFRILPIWLYNKL
jgi:short-subunit dehydrogenase